MADNRVIDKAGRPLVLNHGVTVADWTAEQVEDGKRPAHWPHTVKPDAWRIVKNGQKPQGEQ